MDEKLKKLLENTSSYWDKRSLETVIDNYQKEQDYNTRLKGIYEDVQKDLENKFAKVFSRYANNNSITLKEAYKILPKSVAKSYKNDVYKYIKDAKEHSTDPQWQQYLLNESLKHKYTVLDQLRTEWRETVYKLDKDGTQEKFIKKIAENTDYHTQYSVKDIGGSFSSVDPNYVDNLLKTDWSGGGSFSSNIWKNKEKLVQALDDVLIRGLAQGTSFSKMAQEIAKRCEVSYNNALRLVRTEAAAIQNQTMLDRYKSVDSVKELIFIATLDERTSEICQHMDGEIIPIDEAKIGLNVPPLHPHCRSVMAPHFGGTDKRSMYNPDTDKNETVDWKTYPEYLKDNLKQPEKAEAILSAKTDLRTLTKAIEPVEKQEIHQPSLLDVLEGIAITNVSTEPMTSDERRALNKYVSSGYQVLNDSLRNDYVLDDYYKQMMKDIDAALLKRDTYQGDVVRTLEGIDDLDKFLDDYQIGGIVSFKEFISTDTREKYNVNPQVVYSIKSKTGRDIRELNAMESEILFERNSNFIVTDIQYDENNNVLYIAMDQVI